MSRYAALGVALAAVSAALVGISYAETDITLEQRLRSEIGWHRADIAEKEQRFNHVNDRIGKQRSAIEGIRSDLDGITGIDVLIRLPHVLGSLVDIEGAKSGVVTGVVANLIRQDGIARSQSIIDAHRSVIGEITEGDTPAKLPYTLNTAVSTNPYRYSQYVDCEWALLGFKEYDHSEYALHPNRTLGSVHPDGAFDGRLAYVPVFNITNVDGERYEVCRLYDDPNGYGYSLQDIRIHTVGGFEQGLGLDAVTGISHVPGEIRPGESRIWEMGIARFFSIPYGDHVETAELVFHYKYFSHHYEYSRFVEFGVLDDGTGNLQYWKPGGVEHDCLQGEDLSRCR